MKSFSERKGLKQLSNIIHTNDMPDELRNSLWNALDINIWSSDDFMRTQYGKAKIDRFSKNLWFSYYKLPIDNRPEYNQQILTYIRERFFNYTWNEVYDFLEFLISMDYPRLDEFLNFVLEREMAGYRIINGSFVDITSGQEVEMLQEALSDSRFSGVSTHLEQALRLLADREKPDYRNSIKESISAVEAMARIIAKSPKASLGQALKILEKSGKLHQALKDGFSNLYGYTSDENGIRHAMLEEPNITQADAKYFLLSCTSFVNYLKANQT